VKILQLCTRFPPAPGGVETHVLEISRRMRMAGHDVRVFTSDLFSETPFVRLKEPANDVQGVPVTRFRAYTPGGEAHYLLYPAMKMAVMRAPADVIHAHSYGYFQTNLLPVVKRVRGIPTVMTAHFHPLWSTWGGAKRKGLRRMYDSTLGKMSLNDVDVVISHTKNELELMKKAGLDASKDRVKIVPAGVDWARFTSVPDGASFRKAFSIPDSEPVVLFSGRLAVNKGLMVLADAAPDVLRQFPDTKFVVVGQDMGVREGLERRLKELGIGDRFLFTGHIKDEALFLSAYGACDMLVLPSEYEAFGLVLLEAMASGKPCVATNVGGMPEVLGEPSPPKGIHQTGCGMLVDYQDTGQLARAIGRLLSDKKLRETMGMAGRARVQKEFNWDAVTARILEIYGGLVDR
jgi:glycosyltransferase involved in cell wall biosynthesis